jgi:hypothetical protein
MDRCPAGHEHMLDENLTPDLEPERDPGRLIRLDRSRSFDGEEHVLSVAAYDLHLSCTDQSAIGLNPGFVSDYHLDGLGPDAAIAVAELVASGCWERADGGYRVRDWIAVERSVDRMAERQRLAARDARLWNRTEQEAVLKNVEQAKRGQ